MPDRRLRAVWDVKVPVIRKLAGVHEYDGVVMDLSPSGRKAALQRLGPSSPGERLADRHDESHLSAAEQAAHAEAGAEILQWNPLPHIQNLDLSCYDRDYAPRRSAGGPGRHTSPMAAGGGRRAGVAEAVAAPVAGALVRACGASPRASQRHDRRRGRTGPRRARQAGRAIQQAASHGHPGRFARRGRVASLLGHGGDDRRSISGRLAERADAERERLLNRTRPRTCARSRRPRRRWNSYRSWPETTRVKRADSRRAAREAPTRPPPSPSTATCCRSGR